MDGENNGEPVKLMISGYPYFRKQSYTEVLKGQKNKKNCQMTTWASEKSTHNWLDVDRIHISQQNLYTTDV